MPTFISCKAFRHPMTDPETISAPAAEFLAGLRKTQGYNVEAIGDRVSVAFEPWSLEQMNPFDVPCLRLQFRQIEARIVLERFTIDNDGEELPVNLEAARDALQAWMDSMLSASPAGLL